MKTQRRGRSLMRRNTLRDGGRPFRKVKDNLGNYAVPSDCQDGTLVDVGANVGSFSARYATFFKNILAVEANPHLFGQLPRRLSKFSGAVVLSAAVGSESGRIVELVRHVPRHWDSGSVAVRQRTVQEQEWATRPFATCVQVSLADLIRYVGGHVDFLKVDIEASEYDFLESADLSHVRHIGIELSWQLGPEQWYALVEHIMSTHSVRFGSVEYAVGRNKEVHFSRIA